MSAGTNFNWRLHKNFVNKLGLPVRPEGQCVPVSFFIRPFAKPRPPYLLLLFLSSFLELAWPASTATNSLPFKILSNFWKNKKVISDKSRQRVCNKPLNDKYRKSKWLKLTDHNAVASTCVSLHSLNRQGPSKQFRTRLGQAEGTPLCIIILKVKFGFLVGFEFRLPMLQTVESCCFQTAAIDFSLAGQAC